MTRIILTIAIAIAAALPAKAQQPLKNTAFKGGWTPLNGSTLHHKVVRTYVNGQVAFDGRTVSQSTTGMRLTFKI